MSSKRPATLREGLTREWVRAEAGDRYFARGEAYFRDGAVVSLVQRGETLAAAVLGNRRYQAEIRMVDGGGEPEYDCSCPADGFCKHLVATALAWLHGDADALDDFGVPSASGRPGSSSPRGRSSRAPDLRAYLLSRPPEELADLLLDLAAADTQLRERLRLAAMAANPDNLDVAALRQRVDKAMKLPVFPEEYYWSEDCGSDNEYLKQVEPILATLEKLLDQGQVAPVADLAQHALDRLHRVCQDLEYSRNDIPDIAARLCALHVRACRDAAPDPTKLADWLFRLSVEEATWEFPDLPVADYDLLLGEAGRAHYRHRVEAAWRRLPALTANAREAAVAEGRRRRVLQAEMVRFAQADGDVDALVAVHQKDLSTPDGYTAIARAYRDADRHDEALSWAEQGWNAFNDRYDGGELRELLAEEYRRRGRIDDAIALYWHPFDHRPNLRDYQTLKTQAERDRVWPGWRDKAFARMRAQLDGGSKKSARKAGAGGLALSEAWGEDRTHSLLVDILLWEGKPEEAWKEAQVGGCREELWLKLSAWREKDHPADCLPIWQKRVERLTRDARQSDYDPAAESLKKLGELMERTSQGEAFREQMRALRENLKRRRRFIEALDRLRLP